MLIKILQDVDDHRERMKKRLNTSFGKLEFDPHINFSKVKQDKEQI